MTAEDLIYILYKYYGVSNNIELSDKMDTTQQTISNWKTRNSVSAIKKKCRELGIYNEIFGDSNMYMQNVKDNHGQMSQHVSGNQTFNPLAQPQPPKKEDDVDDATYSLFLEAYKKALKNDDLKGLRVHLMDY